MSALSLRKAKASLKEAATFDSDESVALRIKLAIEQMEKNTGYSLSYGEISEILGVTSRVCYGWAKTGKIAKNHIPTFCNLVGVSIEWLLTGNEPEKGSFAQDERRLYRDMAGVGGEVLTEYMIPIPIREPEEIIQMIEAQNDLSQLPKVMEWVTDSRISRTMALNCLAPDDLRTPTWTYQMTSTGYSNSGILIGDFVLMSHRVMPLSGDFAVVAYKKRGRVLLAAGFVSWPGIDSHMNFTGEGWLDLINFEPMKLSASSTGDSEDSIIVPGAQDNDSWSRITLGVMVGQTRWSHQSSLSKQTKLDERLQARTENSSLDWTDTNDIRQLFDNQ